ncbi:MAG TPA: AMIN domain-containing protein [Gemmatimonadales bacterium]|jgi:type IV pilus assembly protein PilQ|nr:AMIN domain-containing protein [Gemmatimonadales bacterium]
MNRIAALAAGLLVAAAPILPATGVGDGEVRAVSVLPAAGKVSVVIDLRGAIQVQDFTLTNPSRLVLDLQGARLTGPTVLYDGQNRGGVKNVRYAQYKPDVVRVVIELDAAKDYKINQGAGSVTVSFGSDRTAFDAWSSQYAATPAPAPQPPVASTSQPPSQPAQVTTPVSTNPAAVDQFLAAHRAEAAQSQAPRITVQWDKADIADVSAGFAAFSGRTIVVGKGITGTVSAQIKNQPWDLAFQAILESQNLAWQPLPGGIINVVNKADLARADSTVPTETRLVRINYAKSTALQGAVASIVSKRGAVVADTTTNALVITDIQSRIEQDVAFVQALDVRTPQVSIQAKLIFVDRTDVEDMGVKYDLGTGSGCLITGAHPCQFFNTLVQRPDPATLKPIDTNGDGIPDAVVATGRLDPSNTVVDLGGNAISAIGNAGQEVINPALQLIFSTAVGNFNLTSFVQALQTVELADLQAEPSVTTSDNHTAEVLVGDLVPLRTIDVSSASAGGNAVPRATVSFRQTGINLKVTPHVTANRQILMEVHAENSSVKTAPVDIGFTVQTQQADNQILVNDGETAVIGGLTVTNVTVSKSGIPFLVDLPILGKLFGFTNQSEERRDLLILITPHIIDDLATTSAGN